MLLVLGGTEGGAFRVPLCFMIDEARPGGPSLGSSAMHGSHLRHVKLAGVGT